MQYFEILNEDALGADELDKALNCVMLRWHPTLQEEGRYLAAREFGLLLAAALRKIVHTLPRDSAVAFVDPCSACRVDYSKICGFDVAWQSDFFYVRQSVLS